MTTRWMTQILAAAALVAAGTTGFAPSASADVFDKAWQGIVTGDKVDGCKKVIDRSRNLYDKANKAHATHQPLAVSYCNLGGYTVRWTELTLWRRDGTGDGWWNKIYVGRINEDMRVGQGGFFLGRKLQLNEKYKLRVQYDIKHGDRQECHAEFEVGGDGKLLQFGSSGTAKHNNRCKRIKNMKKEAKKFL